MYVGMSVCRSARPFGWVCMGMCLLVVVDMHHMGGDMGDCGYRGLQE